MTSFLQAIIFHYKLLKKLLFYILANVLGYKIIKSFYTILLNATGELKNKTTSRVAVKFPAKAELKNKVSGPLEKSVPYLYCFRTALRSFLHLKARDPTNSFL